jgi:hypothetical protein
MIPSPDPRATAKLAFQMLLLANGAQLIAVDGQSTGVEEEKKTSPKLRLER